MMNPNNQVSKQQRTAILDRLYRRISQLDNEALIQLDYLTNTAEKIEFYLDETDAQADDTYPAYTGPLQRKTAPRSESGASQRRLTRRGFMLALLFGGATVTTGGALALLLNNADGPAVSPAPTLPPNMEPTAIAQQPTLTSAPSSTPPLPTLTPDTHQDDVIASLQQELATSQTDQSTLAGELDNTRLERDTLSSELASAQADVDYLQQVVGLYRQLEAVGLDDTLLLGLGPVGMALLALENGRTALTTGIEDATTRLATIEVQSPTIANGLLWLEDQVNSLSTTLQDLENALSSVVEPVAPITQQIGDFIGQILSLLPFGVGEHIRAGLEAIGTILTHIPELVASINPLVITPLRQWVSPESEDQGLIAEVVNPINNGLIPSAQGMVENSSALSSAYNTQLATPTQDALDARAAIREQIVALTGTV
jgi:uncharacterized phage infection (PIP) family protein YhgE